jgi:Do/DeqQ family serine protease
MSVGAVVHVKTKYNVYGKQYVDPFYQFFFGRPQQQPMQQAQATGSGVILSEDGYIVTNNHVIQQANEIEVVLNDKRAFTAELIGTDPNTDIALLKIDAKGLPTLEMGNSDDLKVGEWVLAVGNPFNLTSTVTAGIVSAKARNINILDAEMKIESFIQTDAAVNPGNSGGALVNTRGELVGINTAIASQTGSYAGYAFAVPTSIVQKVVADLRQFGSVQRALLGIRMLDITSEVQQYYRLNTLEGVYIAEVVSGGAAEKGGVEEGDVITAVDGLKVNSSSELQEKIARKNPGDEVTLTVLRDNKRIDLRVTLTSAAQKPQVQSRRL